MRWSNRSRITGSNPPRSVESRPFYKYSMFRKLLSAVFILFSATMLWAENKVLETYTQLGHDGYTISVERDPAGDKLIRFNGGFGPLSGYLFQTYITSNEDIAYIELHSTGGILNEIGLPSILIRDRQIPVHVRPGEYCVSACAFLALYSPEIDIQGQLAFHLPYMTQFNFRHTLEDIQQNNINLTLLMTKEFYENDIILLLYYLISAQTSVDEFIVFTDNNELNKFRVENEDDFFYKQIELIDGDTYQIKTLNDIVLNN